MNLVRFNDAVKYSGYLPGATPPICHKNNMIVVVDAEVMKFTTVFGGGGVRDKLIELNSQDIVSLNKAIIADIKN